MKVQWAWIALPFSLFGLAMVFLVVVALYTRKAGLQPWKGSIIATLFHGLRHQSDDELHCLTKQNEMDEAVDKMEAIIRCCCWKTQRWIGNAKVAERACCSAQRMDPASSCCLLLLTDGDAEWW